MKNKLISYEYFTTDPDNFSVRRNGFVNVSFTNIEELEEKLDSYINKKYPNASLCGISKYEIVESI